MLLFIQPVSSEIDITIFDETNFIHNEKILWTNREFEVFPELLIGWIEKYQITKTLCITWPWAFTRLRILTLALNTVRLTHPEISVRGIWFFEYAQLLEIKAPYILEANKSEYLVSNKSTLEFVKKHELPSGTYFGFWQESDFTERGISVEYSSNGKQVQKVFDSIQEWCMLSPLYIKEPHITWPK